MTPANPSRPSPSSVNLRGAVDLSSLKNKPAVGTGTAGTGTPGTGTAGTGTPGTGTAGTGTPGTAASGFSMEVSEAAFPRLVELSAEVPVVVELYAAYSGVSVQLSPVLEKLIASYSGRLVLARVDVETSPQIAQAFQAQAVPTVVAVLKGQPVPLFEGALPEEQIRQFLDELLKVAQANGVTGTLDGGDGEPDATDTAEPEPLPPLHQEAFDAIDAGDFAGAAEAYRKALAEQPADAEARAGLVQVELLQRLEGADGDQLREDAAGAPDSVEAQLAVADLDLAGGHVEDAFDRLIAFIGRNAGVERETARKRLVDLFEIVGAADPRVTKARSALARVLF